MLMTNSLVAELVPFGKEREEVMPKYTIRQSYLTEDVYKNVEGKDVQDAIENIFVLTLIPSDTRTEDTETKVELEKV